MARISGSQAPEPRESSPAVASWSELRTPRLSLSAVREDDLEDFFRLHHDDRVYRHSPLARHPDLEHSASTITEISADWARDALGYWSVRELRTSQYLGVGGVRRSGHFDRSGRYLPDGDWNVYYRFRPEFWGNGYAAETIRAAAECCLALDPDAVLVARIRPANTASRRLAERLGMRLTYTQLDVAGDAQLVYEGAAASVGSGGD